MPGERITERRDRTYSTNDTMNDYRLDNVQATDEKTSSTEQVRITKKDDFFVPHINSF